MKITLETPIDNILQTVEKFGKISLEKLETVTGFSKHTIDYCIYVLEKKNQIKLNFSLFSGKVTVEKVTPVQDS